MVSPCIIYSGDELFWKIGKNLKNFLREKFIYEKFTERSM